MNQKEFKITTNIHILFVVIAICSFISGVVLGSYFGYFFAQSTSTAKDKTLVPPTSIEDTASQEDFDSTPFAQPPQPTTNLSVDRYKRMLDKTVQSQTNPTSSHFALVAASFIKPDMAMTKSIEIKERYKEWNVSILKINNMYRVVLGTFPNKKEAQMYQKNLPKGPFFKKTIILPLK